MNLISIRVHLKRKDLRVFDENKCVFSENNVYLVLLY